MAQSEDKTRVDEQEMAEKLMEELKASGVDVEALKEESSGTQQVAEEPKTEAVEVAQADEPVAEEAEVKAEESSDDANPAKEAEIAQTTKPEVTKPDETPLETTQVDTPNTEPIDKAVEPKPTQQAKVVRKQVSEEELATQVDEVLYSLDEYWTIRLPKVIFYLLIALLVILLGGTLSFLLVFAN